MYHETGAKRAIWYILGIVGNGVAPGTVGRTVGRGWPGMTIVGCPGKIVG